MLADLVSQTAKEEDKYLEEENIQKKVNIGPPCCENLNMIRTSKGLDDFSV